MTGKIGEIALVLVNELVRQPDRVTFRGPLVGLDTLILGNQTCQGDRNLPHLTPIGPKANVALFSHKQSYVVLIE